MMICTKITTTNRESYDLAVYIIHFSLIYNGVKSFKTFWSKANEVDALLEANLSSYLV